MLNAILILSLTTSIGLILYTIAKRLLANLPEEHFIHVMTSPLFVFMKKRNHTFKENLGIIWGIIATALCTYIFYQLFIQFQFLILDTKDVLFFPLSHIGLMIFSVLMASFGGTIFLIAYYVRLPYQEKREWKHHPTHVEALSTLKSFKRFGIIVFLITEVFIGLSMLNYVQISETSILCNPFFSMIPIEYKHADIQGGIMDIRAEQRTEGGKGSTKRYTIYVPHFELDLNDGKRVSIWCDDFGTSEREAKNLIQAVAVLAQNKVPIEVEPIGILMRSQLKQRRSDENAQRIRDVFAHATNSSKGLDKPQKKGSAVELDQVEIKVDSTVIRNDLHVFKSPSKGKVVIAIYLSIKNKSNEDFHFSYALGMKLKEGNKKLRGRDLFVQDTLPTTILPYTTATGFTGFEVDEDAKNLELHYEVGLFDDRVIRFDIGDVKDFKRK